MCFRRHFLRKMWPIHLSLLLSISLRLYLYSLTLCNASSFLKRSPTKWVSHHRTCLFCNITRSTTSREWYHRKNDLKLGSKSLIASLTAKGQRICRVYFTILNLTDGVIDGHLAQNLCSHCPCSKDRAKRSACLFHRRTCRVRLPLCTGRDDVTPFELCRC
jgi:hypothetical protein